MTDKILSIKSQIQEAFEKIESQRKDILDFHIKINGKVDADTGDVIIPGWSDILDKDIQDKLEVINNLLDSATTAGLAHSFDTARQKMEASEKKISFAYISVVILLIGFSIFTLFTSNASSLGEFVYSTLPKLPVYGSLIWLAIILSKRRSELFRLAQEYNHKTAVATSYLSFKEQINKLNREDDQMLANLMTQALNTIALNPAATLDKKHGDDLPAQQVYKETKALMQGN